MGWAEMDSSYPEATESNSPRKISSGVSIRGGRWRSSASALLARSK